MTPNHILPFTVAAMSTLATPFLTIEKEPVARPAGFRSRIGGSQRQLRKDRRRLHAAGSKKAFTAFQPLPQTP